MTDFHYSVDAEGVATIVWDVPGRSMNVMSIDGLAELCGLVDNAFGDDAVRGLIVTSAKDSFAGGMDLASFDELRRLGEEGSRQSLFDSIMGTHRLFRRLETGGKLGQQLQGLKPVVAALPGTAAGIGFEIPLACHRIICADNPKAEIGLPEIKVGLFPAAGGTTRLVRKLGLASAGPWLFKGTVVDPGKAHAAGLVDEVVEAGALLDRAREWILGAKDSDLVKPWDRKGFRVPGGTPYDLKGYESFIAAPVMVNGSSFGVYPAVKACLSAIYEGTLVSIDEALRIEARWFTDLLMQPSTNSMIRTVFLNRRALAKGVRRPPGVAEAPIRKLGVIGAGMMGSGISLVAAGAGIDVVMLDSDQARADRGKAGIRKILEGQARRGRASIESVEDSLSRIQPGTSYSDIADADLVIEAVFEDPAIKARVLSAVSDAVGPDCVIASNTSTLPIDGLADSVGDGSSFVGMHFFSPVHRMMLLEIIRGRRTGDAAVGRAIDFAQAVRKVPIIVNDARFFYANRCIVSYINEGIRMVGEGVAPPLVENAAKLAGMPVGPLQLVDETSIDLAASIAAATRAALGDDYGDAAADLVINRLVQLGRLGRKSGAGFYDYGPDGRRTGLWPGLKQEFQPLKDQPGVEDAKDRLLIIQVLEAVRTLEEDVLLDVREGDVGAVLGWGLAVWAGGPFSWIDLVGAGKVAARGREFVERFGARFEPPKLLLDKAATGGRFTAGSA